MDYYVVYFVTEICTKCRKIRGVTSFVGKPDWFAISAEKVQENQHKFFKGPFLKTTRKGIMIFMIFWEAKDLRNKKMLVAVPLNRFFVFKIQLVLYS